MALLAGGARYYPDLAAMLAEDGEQDLGYAPVGGLYVPADPRELDAVERRVRARAADWPVGHAERLSPSEARALFPPLRPDQPALFVSGGARVDGRRVAAALHRAAVKRGARFVSGSAELILQGNRASGVRVGGEIDRGRRRGRGSRRLGAQACSSPRASRCRWRRSGGRSSTCACPGPTRRAGRC